MPRAPAEIHEVPFINMDDGDAPWMVWADWLAAGGVSSSANPGGFCSRTIRWSSSRP